MTKEMIVARTLYAGLCFWYYIETPKGCTRARKLRKRLKEIQNACDGVVYMPIVGFSLNEEMRQLKEKNVMS